MAEKRVTTFWAYLVPNEQGQEDVVGKRLENGVWMPFIGVEEKRVRAFQGAAQEIADPLCRPVTLVRFTKRVDVMSFSPEDSCPPETK